MVHSRLAVLKIFWVLFELVFLYTGIETHVGRLIVVAKKVVVHG